jgi:serpin B
MKRNTLSIIIILAIILVGVLFFMLFGQKQEVSPVEDQAIWTFMPEHTKYGNAVGEFGVSLFKKLQEKDAGQNVFMSPLSIQFALTLCMNGAGGETLEAMKNTLGLTDITLDEQNDAARLLLAGQSGNKVQIDIANSIWHSLRIKLLKSFLEKNSAFDAKIAGLDFANPKSVSTINDWVSEKTRKMIPSILDKIESNIVLIAVNAIYFNGEWANAFEGKNNTKKQFTLDSGAKEDVTLMNRFGKYRYAQNDTLAMVELPYGNGRYSMFVMLPKQGVKLADLFAGLDWDTCKTIIESLARREGNVSIPIFNTSYGVVDIVPELVEMGMGIAFSEFADFSGIAEGKSDLSISKVLHKAEIKVNEKGTEAAAVTAVLVEETAILMDPPEPFSFIADRPFAYIIMDNASSVPIFMGKLEKPE